MLKSVRDLYEMGKGRKIKFKLHKDRKINGSVACTGRIINQSTGIMATYFSATLLI